MNSSPSITWGWHEDSFYGQFTKRLAMHALKFALQHLGSMWRTGPEHQFHGKVPDIASTEVWRNTFGNTTHKCKSWSPACYAAISVRGCKSMLPTQQNCFFAARSGYWARPQTQPAVTTLLGQHAVASFCSSLLPTICCCLPGVHFAFSPFSWIGLNVWMLVCVGGWVGGSFMHVWCCQVILVVHGKVKPVHIRRCWEEIKQFVVRHQWQWSN